MHSRYTARATLCTTGRLRSAHRDVLRIEARTSQHSSAAHSLCVPLSLSLSNPQLTFHSSLSPLVSPHSHSVSAAMALSMSLLVFCCFLLLVALPLTAAGSPKARFDQLRSSPSLLARAISDADSQPAPPIVEPNTTAWVSLKPCTVHYSHGSIYAAYKSVALDGESGLMKLDSADGSIVARLSLDPAVIVVDQSNLISSKRSLFAQGGQFIVEVDMASFTVVNQLRTPNEPEGSGVLLGVDAAGTTLLWSVWGGSQAYTLDARTGNITGNYTAGQTTLAVQAGALHPTDGSMLLADDISTTLLLIDRHDQLIYRVPYPGSSRSHSHCLSVVVDAAGDNAYGVFMPRTTVCFADDPFYYTIVHFNYSTGAMVDRAYIECSHYLNDIIHPAPLSAADNTSQLYYVNHHNGTVNLFSLATGTTESSYFLTEQPYNRWPTPLATMPVSGLLVVGQYETYRYLNDSTGRQVGEMVDLTPYWAGKTIIAIDAAASGTVYAATSNHPMVVMQLLANGTSVLVRRLDIGSDTWVQALAVDEPRSVLYWIDRDNASYVTKCDLEGRLIGTLLGQPTDQFVDIAVDTLGDGSLWAMQNHGTTLASIYHWSANGTLLALWYMPRELHTFTYIDVNHRYKQVVATVEDQDSGLDSGWMVLWLDASTGQQTANHTIDAWRGLGGVAVSSDGRKVFTTLLEETTILGIASPSREDEVQWADGAVPYAALLQ